MNIVDIEYCFFCDRDVCICTKKEKGMLDFLPGNDHLAADVLAELAEAQMSYPKFHSAHEGYAVLLEEVDELWQIVMMKPGLRSKTRMREEAIQVAAMAMRFIKDCCED